MLTNAELIADIQAEIGETSSESVELTGHLTSAESCETLDDLKFHLLLAKQSALTILTHLNDELDRIA